MVTGHSQSGEPLKLDWATLADADKTIVIYMGLANIELICHRLIEAGLDMATPAAAIQNGTTANQQRVLSTLYMLPADTRKAMLQAPVLFVIGKVVSLANTLDWFATDQAIGEYFADKAQSKYG